MSHVFFGLTVLALTSNAPVSAALPEVHSAKMAEVTYGGSANCQIECTGPEGKKQCKNISCSGSGYLSYESAQSSLKSMLEIKARAEQGNITGSISFNIEKKIH